MNEFVILDDRPTIAIAILSLLKEDYANLFDLTEKDFQDITTKVKIKDAIKKVLTAIGVKESDATSVDTILPGDVIEFLGRNSMTYLVISQNENDMSTFPTVLKEHVESINSKSKNFIIKRYDYSKIDKKKFESTASRFIEGLKDKLRDSVVIPDVVTNFPDSALQIGDLIFIVDPTQISFTTQNGWQYFPTLRTAGNPKIPTMEQVKNVSITLLFPNENSINYQLLPLFAMFKRTPFVCLRNKDICDFYQELKNENDPYIPVALENIHIQSIDGYPNTLQVTMTVLPFYVFPISNGLKALKSFSDVQKQQSNLYENSYEKSLQYLTQDLLDSKNENDTKSAIKDMMSVVVDHTTNFRLSLPFRAYYQALIEDHKFITDENGQIVSITGDGTLNKSGFKLDNLRPLNSFNRLRHYYTDSNKEPFTLKYSYIQGDFRNTNIKLSEIRDNKINSSLDQLSRMADLLKTPDDLINMTLTSFLSFSDVLEITKRNLNENIAVIQRVAALHNIDIPATDGNYSDSIWPHILGIFSSGLSLGLIDKSIIPEFWQFYHKDIPNITKGVEFHEPDITGIGSQLFSYISKQEPFSTGNGVTTIYNHFQKLFQWMENNETRKINFAGFLKDLALVIKGDLNTDIIVLDATTPTPESARVVRLPIVSDEIKINTQSDVITGWSLIFNNSLIPIYLQAIKYPFYQHLGCDDISMSLKITSTGNSTLKENLSVLSDRLYESVKTITLTSPDLITWMNPYLTIESPIPHTIFDAFGIKRAIFNSSTTTNIQGSPNSWNTVIQLTQNNFTIADYHGVTNRIQDAILENEISKLIGRIQIVDGKYQVLKFHDSDGGLVTDLNKIIEYNFATSSHAWHFATQTEYAVNDRKGPVSGNTFDQYRNNFTYSDYVQSQTNNAQSPSKKKLFEIDTETQTNLDKLLSENKAFADLFKLIINKYDSLMKAQAEAITNVLLTSDKSFWGNFKTHLTSDKGLWLKLLFGLSGIAVSAGYETAINNAKNLIKPYIVQIAEEFKIGILFEFSKQIKKDIALREKLLSLSSTGINSLNSYLQNKNIKPVNCYPDHDAPSFYAIKDNNNTFTIRLEPDFYLYAENPSSLDVLQYLSESQKRDLNPIKFGLMQSVLEYKDIYEKFAVLQNTFESDSDLNKKGDENSTVARFKKEIEWNTDLKTSMEKLEKLYMQLALNKVDLSQATVDEQTKNTLTEIGNLTQITNPDYFKLHYLRASRNKLLLELMTLSSSINSYFINQLPSQRTNPAPNKSVDIFKLIGSDKSISKIAGDTLSSLQADINTILSDFDQGIIPPNLKNKYKNGLSNLNTQQVSSKDKNVVETISLPGIRNLQNYFYNKIAAFIRLNEALREYEKGGRVDLSGLGELEYLQFWNVRNFESTYKNLELRRLLFEENSKRSYSGLRMFPTFRFFFIENERGTFKQLDQFFGYDAIQSIEIHRSKSSASTTARVLLSNAVGTITDKFNFNRNPSNWFQSNTNPDEFSNTFFGSLDIKPGTTVLIKMGYASNDKDLQTIFIGKIINMNVGPTVEIVCQSFAAQLNHEILAEKFGLFATKRALGDVASAIIDHIPAIEKLGGKQSEYTFSKFSGTGIDRWRGSFGDRFLLSNLLNRITSDRYIKDNPRDENLYLPYDLAVDVGYAWKPTFDWVIQNQSVWEALQEISLHQRNTVPLIRLYNDDTESDYGDIRETIIVGDKSGYYKTTDANLFSTLDTNSINKAVEEWNTIKKELDTVSASYKNLKMFDYKTYNSVANSSKIFEWVQNPLNALILQKYLYIYLNLDNSLLGLAVSLGTKETLPSVSPEIRAISLLKILSSGPILPYSPEGYKDDDLKSYNNKIFIYGVEFIPTLVKLYTQKENPLDFSLNPEDFYDVALAVNNLDPALSKDRRYKKIQQHHYINDMSNIISNNLTLSNSFNNTIDLYFRTEPNLNKGNDFRFEDYTKMSVFTLKSFGDLRDEDMRVMSSYQKNIDTNWFDIPNRNKLAYGGYEKIKFKDKNFLMNLLQKEETDTPTWKILPSFVTVGVNLLQREVAKMYQGTIEIIGDPTINPYDIIHMDDYVNDIHGAFEVDEVITSFTPNNGFRTIIVPNLIAYDRDPVQLQDIEVMNRAFTTAKSLKLVQSLKFFAGLGFTALGIGGLITPGTQLVGAGVGIAGLCLSYSGATSFIKTYSSFAFDSMMNLFGRDCINFSTLMYHGSPYMSGFGGVDYTNLKTIINHQLADIPGVITRLVAAKFDPVNVWMASGYNASEITLTDLLGFKMGSIFGAKITHTDNFKGGL